MITEPLRARRAPERDPTDVRGIACALDPQAKFISVVLADTEDTWEQIFQKRGQPYQPPVLVLFDGATQSGCGLGRAEGHHVQKMLGLSDRVKWLRRGLDGGAIDTFSSSTD